MHRIHEKKQRTTNDIFIPLSDEEENFRKKFHHDLNEKSVCTICGNITINKAYPHPALNVIVCFDCLKSYQNTVFLSRTDGTDKNCRWCGIETRRYNCTVCTVVFCKKCLDQNSVRYQNSNSNWKCLICDPQPLWRLRALCTKTMDNNSCNIDNAEPLNITFPTENRLPLSQLAEANSDPNNYDLSSESSIAEKKPIKSDSEENKISSSRQQSQMSDDLKQYLKEQLETTNSDFESFISLFSKRKAKFSKKIMSLDVNDYDDAERLVNKVSRFCEMAIENIQFIQKNNQLRFEIWANKLKSNFIDSDTESKSDISVDIKDEINKDAVEKSQTNSEKFDDFLTNIRNDLSSEKNNISTSDSKSTVSFLSGDETVQESNITQSSQVESLDLIQPLQETEIKEEKIENNDYQSDFSTETRILPNENADQDNQNNKQTDEKKNDDVEMLSGQEYLNNRILEDFKDEEDNISIEDLDRESAFQNLLESDSSDSSSNSESSTTSSFSDEEQKQSDSELKHNNIKTGYIKQLNLAEELAKLQKNQHVFVNQTIDENDSKLKMKPLVMLEKFDFEKCYGISKKENGFSLSNNSDDEIERLTNLRNLKKRNIIYSSESDNESELVSKKLKKKKKKNVISDSDSLHSLKLESEEELDLLENLTTNIPTDLLNDNKSDTEEYELDKLNITKDKKKPTKDKKSDTDDDENEPKQNKKSKWRQDKLLTGALNLISSEESDLDSESLKKQEEKYLQNVDKKKKRRKSSSSANDEDTITVSDSDDDSDYSESDTDSDIQIVGVKRKRNSEEHKKNMKGRKNIREVLDDNELNEETKKADKEESRRKERITLKQKTLENVLSESQLLSQDEVGLVLDVDEELKQATITVHYSLVSKLKPHQQKGIKFMWDVCFESVKELQNSDGAGCILAHCMGLGKTMQVVVFAHTLLTHEITQVKHILIVCPLSIVFNWRNEFETTLKVCAKKINLFDIRSDRQKTYMEKIFEVKKWKKDGGVIIMGYESYQSLVNPNKINKLVEEYKNWMLESLIDPGPNVIICDEGHMLKNGKSIRFHCLSRIKTKRRIILTGTPLQNNLEEYYHMVNFVKPYLLGTFKEYRNRFVHPISNGQYEDSKPIDIKLMKSRSHILHKKLENTVQRFEESELIPYLPKRFDYVLFVQLTDLQIQLYELYLSLLNTERRNLFKNYHALQNIWTHPALLKLRYNKKKEPQVQKKYYDQYFVPVLDPDSEKDTFIETDWFKDQIPNDLLDNISYGVKMQVLFSIINECEQIGDKLLVFSSSIDELDLIEHFLKQNAVVSGKSWVKDIDYYRMDGTVPPERRMKYCNDFNNKINQKARLFLISHKVGGLGLNLTAANRVVIMDVSWNPAYDIQSIFRVYRFGQTKNCYIYRFVSMGTMEEVVYSRAITKLAVACRVVDEQQIKRHFNSDDLQRMYTLIKDYSKEPQTPTLPSDMLLAKLWENHKPMLYKFCDHKSLLENLPHEELNEEEMKMAWEEFRSVVEAEKQFKEMTYIKKIYNPADLPGTSTQPISIIAATSNNMRYKKPVKYLTSDEMLARIFSPQNLQQIPASNNSLVQNNAPIDLTEDNMLINPMAFLQDQQKRYNVILGAVANYGKEN